MEVAPEAVTPPMEKGRAARKDRSDATRVQRLVLAWARPVAALALLLGLWQGAVLLFEIPAWKLPAPYAVAKELVASRALFLRHAWVTLGEALIGFGVAFLLGVFLATLMAFFRGFQRTVYPLVIASQTIPVIVISPLLLVWIGYGLAPKVVVVVLITFFPIVVNVMDGLRSVDLDMVNMMRTLGASRWQIFRKVQVPSAMPFLFSGTKVAVTFSVIGAVVGEWVGSSAGLGYLTRVSVPLFLTVRSFGAVFLLALMGILLFLTVVLLERVALPWHYRARQSREREEEAGL